MNCAEANRMSIVDFLARLGHEPKKVSRMDYWYLSPLREEKSPSFKVNKEKNCWYDHGLGRGGTLVDFVMLLQSCDVSHALQTIASSHGLQAIKTVPIILGTKQIERAVSLTGTSGTSLEILSAKQPLADPWLFGYAKQRNISKDVLNQWCFEVDFIIHDKQYKAIGFRNIEGGYELRNNWFKGSSSPKAVTFLKNNSAELAVFEGFFDFLTYQSVCLSTDKPQPDIIVLNSLSFFESKLLLIQEYKRAHLYLDNDHAGRKWTDFALQQSSCFQDKSELYRGYKDLNDWHLNFGKKLHQKQSI